MDTNQLEASPVRAFQARTIARALRLYAKTGLKPNRAYTPSAMLATASNITGLTFKRGEYERAAQACDFAAETIMTLAAYVKANPAATREEAFAAVKEMQLAAK